MIKYNARFIIIDNNEAHLSALARGLHRQGIACLPHLYDGSFPSADQITCVRAIFCDLHLDSDAQTTDAKPHVSRIISFLEKEISDTNGPYILIIWSQYSKLSKHIDSYLDNMHPLKRPVAYDIIDKNKYIDLDTGVEIKNSRLEKRIEESLEPAPAVNALISWESAAVTATSATVAGIYGLADPKKFSETQRPAALAKLLGHLALESAGKKFTQDRARSIFQALTPLFSDKLLYSQPDTSFDWSKAVARPKANTALDSNIVAQLNSVLHIDKCDPSVEGSSRGVVCPLPTSWQSSDQFEARFGNQEELLRNSYGYKTLRGGRTYDWYLIQIEASCDAAQNKPGIKPYVLTAFVPESHKGDVKSNEQCPRPLWVSPLLEIFDQHGWLHVNTMFMIGLTRETASTKLEVALRLREQILDDLIYRARTHAARPGIIALR